MEAKGLRRLDLSFTYVTDRGMEKLPQLQQLEELTLNTAEFITDASMSYLRANKRLQSIVYEAHPELAFARMNGGRPVLSKKRQPDGYAERRRLLARHGFRTRIDRLPGAARDDILDAIAVCRTATLIASGRATCLGPADERDRHGLPMNIWF